MLESSSIANTKYSIIQYDNKPSIKGLFEDFSNAEDVKRLLEQLQWEGDGKNVDESLKVASELFQSKSRPASTKVIVLFTGETVQFKTPKLQDIVDKLAKNGVKIIPVLVGISPDSSTFENLKPNVEDSITGLINEDPSRVAHKIEKGTFTGDFVKHNS